MTENEERIEELKNAIIEMVSISEDAVMEKDFEELDNAGVEIIKRLDELEEYRALEQKLQAVYGEHAGLLEIIVNGLVKYEKAPDKATKAVLLTDDDVDKWEQLKAIGTVDEFKALKEKNNKDFELLLKSVKESYPMFKGAYVELDVFMGDVMRRFARDRQKT